MQPGAARGARAQRGGKGGAEGSPHILVAPQVPEKDLGFQRFHGIKKPCSALELLQAALGGRR